VRFDVSFTAFTVKDGEVQKVHTVFIGDEVMTFAWMNRPAGLFNQFFKSMGL